MGAKDMMTRLEITAAIEQIRAKVHRDDVLDAKPVAAKWKPTPPFVALANPHASRGHIGAPCNACKQALPLGGWAAACLRGDARTFTGG
jgi:hypothetical protein